MGLNKWTEVPPEEYRSVKRASSIEFRDWTEMLEFADRAPSTYGNRSSRSDYNKKWYGGLTFPDAVNMGYSGWLEGAEWANKFYLQAVEGLASLIEIPEVYYDTEGWGFDTARFVEGEPEHWVRYEQVYREGVGRVTRVVVNNSASAIVQPDVITRRGAALAALVQLLEFAGRPVELLVTFACESGWGGSARLESTVHLKAPGQPLDLPRVAFALSHPAMFRRIHFSIWECHPDKYYHTNLLNHCYGCPNITLLKGDVVIERMYGGENEWSSDDLAEAFILSELAKQGVRLKPHEDRR